MAFLEKNNIFTNKIRTTLLLLVNRELSLSKKNVKTKINSKKITEAENYYCSKNDYIIKLQDEQFVPNSLSSDVIENKNIKNNFSYKSPDQEIYNFNECCKNFNKDNPSINIKNEQEKIFDKAKNPINLYDIKKFSKKSDISSKKNEHFKKKTLKLNKEIQIKKQLDIPIEKRTKLRLDRFQLDKSIKNINRTYGLNNLKEKQMIENGYCYLQRLAKEMKIIEYKSKINLDFEEMTKVIKESNNFKRKGLSKNIKKENKSDNEIKLQNNSFEIYRNKKHKEHLEKVLFLNNKAEDNYITELNNKLTYSNDIMNEIENEVICTKNLKSEEINNKFRSNRRNSLWDSKPKNSSIKDDYNIELNECSFSKFYNCDERIKNETKNLLSNKFLEIPNNISMRSSYNDTTSSKKEDSCNSKSNKLDRTYSFNYSKSNSSGKFNIILINAAESYKSLTGGYSFKIKLNKMEEEESNNKAQAVVDNDYFEDKNNYDNNFCGNQKNSKNFQQKDDGFIDECEMEEIKIFNSMNNPKSYPRLTNFESCNNLNKQFEEKKYDQHNNFGKKHSVQSLKKNKSRNKSIFGNIDGICKSLKPDKLSKDNNSHNYYFDFDSKLNSHDKPYKNKTNIKSRNKKANEVKEANIIGRSEEKNKKLKYSFKEDSSGNKQNNNENLNSTNSNSFIKLRKINKEHLFNSKERANSNRIINLLTNESENDENSQDKNYITLIKSDQENQEEIIHFKNIPIETTNFNLLNKSETYYNNSINNNVAKKNKLSNLLLKRDTIESIYLNNELNNDKYDDSKSSKSQKKNRCFIEKNNVKKSLLNLEKFSVNSNGLNNKLRFSDNHKNYNINKNANSEDNYKSKYKKGSGYIKNEVELKQSVDNNEKNKYKNSNYYENNFENYKTIKRFSLKINNRMVKTKKDDCINDIEILRNKSKLLDNFNKKDEKNSDIKNGCFIQNKESKDFEIKLFECSLSEKNPEINQFKKKKPVSFIPKNHHF